MKNRMIKILGYGICLISGACLLIFLFILLGQHKWLADVLGELFAYLMVGLCAAVLLIYIKPKQKKIISLGLIAIILCLLAIPFFNASIFSGKNGLSKKVETVELSYIAWACDCANWATKEDLKKYADNNEDTLARQCIFIESANQSLELPDTLGHNNQLIRFTGQFYNEKGFPEGYQSFEDPEKARVFRYTEYEVVGSSNLTTKMNK